MSGKIARVWPLLAALAGCAGGAPVDTEASATAATLLTMSSSDGTTSTTSPTGSSAADETSTGGETTTGTSGEPETSSSTTGEVAPPLDPIYPTGQTHSPITPEIAEALLAIRAAGPDKVDGVFAKIGGTTTASAQFLACLATPASAVGLAPELLAAANTLNATLAGMEVTSFSRVSAAAAAGWTSADLITGMPTPIAAELSAIGPRFAVVLLGTHDLDLVQPDALFAFADNLVVAVDALIAGGTIPILTTIPRRADAPAFAAHVPRYNAVVRAVAQGRKIPLVDLEHALSALATQGLAADGIDLDVYTDAMMVAQPCNFAAEGLAHGYNVRNLVTLEALARVHQVVVAGGAAPDATAPQLMGSGTTADPFKIPGLPFADLRNTQDSPSDVIEAYNDLCTEPEPGPEYVYELTIEQPTTLRAMLFDRDPVDVDLHLMTMADPETCVKRDDKLLEGPLQPGTYYLVVDTFGADAAAGEFAFVVLAEG